MRSQGFVVGDNGAPAAAGDGFIAVEAVYAEGSEGAGLFFPAGAAQGFGGVFDQKKIMLPAEFRYLFDPAGVAKGMHGYTGAYPSARCLVAADIPRLFGVLL